MRPGREMRFEYLAGSSGRFVASQLAMAPQRTTRPRSEVGEGRVEARALVKQRSA